MDINKILSNWQFSGNSSIIPDYLSDSVASISLLNTLTDFGYEWNLENSAVRKTFRLIFRKYSHVEGNDYIYSESYPTIYEAIVFACVTIAKGN